VGIRNRDEVEDWRRLYLFLPEQQLDELPEGYYYEHHLVGLECVNRDGDALGTITAMEDSGGQTRVVVRRERREFLVPWVPAIVVEVRLDDGRVVLDPPRGLLDDDAVMA
jgi:16S rRNA processing protein RimM